MTLLPTSSTPTHSGPSEKAQKRPQASAVLEAAQRRVYNESMKTDEMLELDKNAGQGHGRKLDSWAQASILLYVWVVLLLLERQRSIFLLLLLPT